MSTPNQLANQASLHTPRPLPQPFGQILLDGSGHGVAQIGPQRVREHWQPVSASVKVSTKVSEAQCTVFMGTTKNDATFLGQTATGSSGDTCGFLGQDMQTGMQIFAEWTGGDPGSLATVVVNGTYTIGAPS